MYNHRAKSMGPHPTSRRTGKTRIAELLLRNSWLSDIPKANDNNSNCNDFDKCLLMIPLIKMFYGQIVKMSAVLLNSLYLLTTYLLYIHKKCNCDIILSTLTSGGFFFQYFIQNTLVQSFTLFDLIYNLIFYRH